MTSIEVLISLILCFGASLKLLECTYSGFNLTIWRLKLDLTYYQAFCSSGSQEWVAQVSLSLSLPKR